MYCVSEWITLLCGCMCCSVVFWQQPEDIYVVKNSVKIKSDIVFFARKRYTVTVNGTSVSPSWFCCALNSWLAELHADFFSRHASPLEVDVLCGGRE